ncbi:hypothetical protein BWD09_13530, partial [Neisseria dentiae]
MLDHADEVGPLAVPFVYKGQTRHFVFLGMPQYSFRLGLPAEQQLVYHQRPAVNAHCKHLLYVTVYVPRSAGDVAAAGLRGVGVFYDVAHPRGSGGVPLRGACDQTFWHLVAFWLPFHTDVHIFLSLLFFCGFLSGTGDAA